jgi:transcriptional regulator with XRE-family HTH domain
MTEEREELFRGHIEECLRNLKGLLPENPWVAAEHKKPLANFCGVSLDSVNQWLNGKSLPVGEKYIKLMCYLDAIGYKIIELEKTPKTLRNFAELIGFGVITSKEAIELLGYSSTSTLYNVLQCKQGISEDKENKMWEIWKNNRESLEEQKRLFRSSFLDIPLKIQPEAESLKKEKDFLPTSIKGLGKIMEGLLHLLEENSFSKKDLEQYTEIVLQLSARLSALSSTLIMQQTTKKGGRS